LFAFVLPVYQDCDRIPVAIPNVHFASGFSLVSRRRRICHLRLSFRLCGRPWSTARSKAVAAGGGIGRKGKHCHTLLEGG
jgi:hypothetical protein